MSAPTIWEAISDVNIADYATRYLGYTLHKGEKSENGDRLGKSVKLKGKFGSINAGIQRGTGANVWKSFSQGGEGNLLTLLHRDLNLSPKSVELAVKVIEILGNYHIPYSVPPEYEGKIEKTRIILPSKEQAEEYNRKKKERIAIELAKVTKEEAERKIAFTKALGIITRNEKFYTTANGKNLRGIPLKWLRMMGNKTTEEGKKDPNYNYLKGNCIHTKYSSKSGDYNQLNFILRDENLKVIGIARKNAETGKDERLAYGSVKGCCVFGNQEGKNMILTENPLDALSFNVAKGVEFKDTLHISTMGAFSELTKDICVKILQDRIDKNIPTTIHLAFDNDKQGRKYTEEIMEIFSEQIKKVDPEGTFFKMGDSKCPIEYSDYNDYIRDIKKDDKGNIKQEEGFDSTLNNILSAERLYTPTDEEDLLGVDAKWWRMLGNKATEEDKKDPNSKYLEGNCLYTKHKEKNGKEYGQLNFIIKDIGLNTIGVAKKNEKIGWDEKKATKEGDINGYSILGNRESSNIVLTKSPINAISFNVAKKVSFEKTAHLSLVGGLSTQRLDELERILEKRIQQNKATTFYLAFDNNQEGEEYIESINNRFKETIDRADPEGKSFKVIDARCPPEYSDYNDFIRGIKKDDGGGEGQDGEDQDGGKRERISKTYPSLSDSSLDEADERKSQEIKKTIAPTRKKRKMKP